MTVDPFADHLTVKRLQEELSRWSYKPGWEMRIEPDPSPWVTAVLIVRYEAPDSRDPSRTIPIAARELGGHERGLRHEHLRDVAAVQVDAHGAPRVAGVAAMRRRDLRRSAQGQAVTRTGFACPCGHAWLLHDIDEFDGDGSDLCCVERCDQVACPGSQNKIVLSGRWTEPTSTER